MREFGKWSHVLFAFIVRAFNVKVIKNKAYFAFHKQLLHFLLLISRFIYSSLSYEKYFKRSVAHKHD